MAEQPEAGPDIWCISGLGNPGSRYDQTPHNAGFWVVDELSRRWNIPVSRQENNVLFGNGQLGSKAVILVKPQNFMNRSGEGVSAVLRFRKLTAHNLIAIYDELDLPWSALRIREGGSAAGHNGVKSLIGALKSDAFVRVRMGIRPDHPIRDAADYVLAPLERELAVDVDEVVSYTADAVESIVADGAAQAMTKFNRRARGLHEEDK